MLGFRYTKEIVPNVLFPNSRRDVPHPDLAGAALIWLLSLPGGLLAVFLTVLKFRSAYRCDESLLSACQIGELFDCGRVLTSPWSSLFEVPISAYAASYYGLMLGLATCVLWKPHRFLPAVRPVLLMLAWAGLIVVALLGSYAGLGLRSFCLQCAVLYALGAAIFLAASLMNPRGHRVGLAALWAPRVPRRGVVLLIGGLSFLALTTVQALLYRRGAVSAMIEDRCILRSEASDSGVPATALRTGEKTPEVEVVLFLDLACPKCSEEFHAWRADVAGSRGKYALSMLHFPREGDCIPPEFKARSRPSELNFSCRGAAAVECVEGMAPGKGLDMVTALFELQGGRTPYFSDGALVKAAQGLGLPVTTELSDPFIRCLDDPRIYAHIRTHAVYGMQRGLTETPGTLFVFYEDDIPSDDTLLIKGAKDYGDIEQFLAEARVRVLGPRSVQ
jgi:uncharacterized membrane protein